MDDSQDFSKILTDTRLARFGDALLNFAFSIALTEVTGQPTGTKVSDKTLAEAAVKAGLRKQLPRRVGRGDVANSIEALLGFVWLHKIMNLDNIVACLKENGATPAEGFTKLAESALSRLGKQENQEIH